MIGILVQLAISWAIVWWFEKGNLGCLGFTPTRKRVLDFIFFFLMAVAFAVCDFLLKMLIAKQSWMLNPSLSSSGILQAIWFTIKSVLFEELIFRGVLLYILIKKWGRTPAIIISAVAFGVYHWFSHELWGNTMQMAIEFVMSGLMGLILAYGYAKSKSLYIPIAIHLGWNLVMMVVFSGSSIGPQLFIPVLPRQVVTISYFSFFVMQLLPILSWWLLNIWLLRRYKQAV
jgi:membrane protease YdiL (CAAX protease family)